MTNRRHKNYREATPEELAGVRPDPERPMGLRFQPRLPAKLEDLHRYAVCLFQGAITRELHSAMGPTEE